MNNTAQNKKCEILIVIDDLIADMLSNRTVNSIVTELFTRSGKLIITLVFITPFHFDAPKNIRQLYSLFYYENPKKENVNKSYLIIHQILTSKTLSIFTENILFLLHQ